jgi:hypothetical protein
MYSTFVPVAALCYEQRTPLRATMQTNNRTNSVRKFGWIALGIGIIVCVFVVPFVWLSFSSNVFPECISTYISPGHGGDGRCKDA